MPSYTIPTHCGLPINQPKKILQGTLVLQLKNIELCSMAPTKGRPAGAMNHDCQPRSWPDAEERVRFTQRKTALPLLILGRDFGLYFASLGVAIAPIAWPLCLAASVWAGIMIGGIFVAGHDACHQALTPSRKLNNWIGRLALAPAWTTRSLWIHFHNRIHHVYTNVIGIDYAVSPLSLALWRRAGGFRRTIYRLYRSPIGFLPYYLIEMWWKAHFLPWDTRVRPQWRAHLPDASFAMLWQVGLVSLIFVVAPRINPDATWVHLLVLGWLLPYLAWNTLIGIVIYAHHTHPDVAWCVQQDNRSTDLHIKGVVHAVLPQPLKMLSSDIMEHNAHHVLPTIPHYHLAAAQRELELRFPSIPRMVVLSRQMLGVIKACKLYDTERNCWVDFAGRQTGPIHTRRPV
jgi:omega-6 fatty acid desaturase (delta-12 desaturase)